MAAPAKGTMITSEMKSNASSVIGIRPMLMGDTLLS